MVKGDRLLDELRPAVQQITENQRLKKEAGELRRQIRRLTGFDQIIGTSPKMRTLFDMIATIAPQSSRVLITGESGTGKGTRSSRNSREQRAVENTLYYD